MCCGGAADTDVGASERHPGLAIDDFEEDQDAEDAGEHRRILLNSDAAAVASNPVAGLGAVLDHADGLVSARRVLSYAAHLLGSTSSLATQADAAGGAHIGFGLTPLPAPLLRSAALMGLGSTTTTVVSDRGVVAERDPRPETIMFFTATGDGAVVDLHLDRHAPTGVRLDSGATSFPSNIMPIGVAAGVAVRGDPPERQKHLLPPRRRVPQPALGSLAVPPAGPRALDVPARALMAVPTPVRSPEALSPDAAEGGASAANAPNTAAASSRRALVASKRTNSAGDLLLLARGRLAATAGRHSYGEAALSQAVDGVEEEQKAPPLRGLRSVSHSPVSRTGAGSADSAVGQVARRGRRACRAGSAGSAGSAATAPMQDDDDCDEGADGHSPASDSGVAAGSRPVEGGGTAPRSLGQLVPPSPVPATLPSADQLPSQSALPPPPILRPPSHDTGGRPPLAPVAFEPTLSALASAKHLLAERVSSMPPISWLGALAKESGAATEGPGGRLSFGLARGSGYPFRRGEAASRAASDANEAKERLLPVRQVHFLLPKRPSHRLSPPGPSAPIGGGAPSGLPLLSPSGSAVARAARKPWVRSTFTTTVVESTVEEQRLEAFTMGDVGPVLERCPSMWDGLSVVAMDRSQKSDVAALAKQWRALGMSVTALSHMSVESPSPRNAPLAATASVADRVAPLTGPELAGARSSTLSRLRLLDRSTPKPGTPTNADARSEAGSVVTEPSSGLAPSQTVLVGAGEALQAGVGSPSRPSRSSGARASRQLREDARRQVFLGIAAAGYRARRGAALLASSLQRASISFVYASARDADGARPLAERLGLPTGWNTSVSLRPPGLAKAARVSRSAQPARVSNAGATATVAAAPAAAAAALPSAAAAPAAPAAPAAAAAAAAAAATATTAAAGATAPVKPVGQLADENYLVDAEGNIRRRVDPRANPRLRHNSTAASLGLGVQARLRAIQTTRKVQTHWRANARMPRGLEEIRRNLGEQDDIPLRVPLLTDATPADLEGMLDLYRANGHVVTVAGSALRAELPVLARRCDALLVSLPGLPAGLRGGDVTDSRSAQANTANDPAGAAGGGALPVAGAGLRAMWQRWDSPHLRLVSAVAHLDAAISMPSRVPLNAALPGVADARRAVEQSSAAVLLMLLGELLLAAVVALPTAAGLPPGLATHQFLVMAWIVLPILCLGVALLPSPSLTMSEHRVPAKRAAGPPLLFGSMRALAWETDQLETPPGCCLSWCPCCASRRRQQLEAAFERRVKEQGAATQSRSSVAVAARQTPGQLPIAQSSTSDALLATAPVPTPAGSGEDGGASAVPETPALRISISTAGGRRRGHRRRRRRRRRRGPACPCVAWAWTHTRLPRLAGVVLLAPALGVVAATLLGTLGPRGQEGWSGGSCGHADVACFPFGALADRIGRWEPLQLGARPSTSLDWVAPNWSATQRQRVAAVQGVTQWAMSVCLVLVAAAVAHRGTPLWVEAPWRARSWRLAAALACGIGLLDGWLAASWAGGEFHPLALWAEAPRWVWAAHGVWLPLAALVLLLAKWSDDEQLQEAMKRLRQHFETKLGMFSPR